MTEKTEPEATVSEAAKEMVYEKKAMTEISELEKQIDDIVADRVLSVLNRAFRADPEAVGTLISTRYECNEALANDPAIQVHHNKDEECYEIGMLGILNGCTGIIDNPESQYHGFGHIAAVYTVDCNKHGPEHPKNEGKKVGDACGVEGCQYTLQLGKLVRFDKIKEAVEDMSSKGEEEPE